jgi:hypothetical protein
VELEVDGLFGPLSRSFHLLKAFLNPFFVFPFRVGPVAVVLGVRTSAMAKTLSRQSKGQPRGQKREARYRGPGSIINGMSANPHRGDPNNFQKHRHSGAKLPQTKAQITSATKSHATGMLNRSSPSCNRVNGSGSSSRFRKAGQCCARVRIA